MIYLDNAATTKIKPDVLRAMMPYLTKQYGNAGSLHKLGRESAAAIEKAREQVAELIGAESDNIVFTSGGSEANTLIFKGLKDHLKAIGKTHIITSIIEHDSVIHATEALIKEGFDVTYLPVNDHCKVSPDALKQALREDTGLVFVMYVNNETGVEQPIKEIAEICSKNNILFATDAVQALGFQDIDVIDIGCDFLSMSGHKIHAPKGIGGLYVKNKELLSPLINGGAHQEFGLRGGTENVAGIVGFGEACDIANQEREYTHTLISMVMRNFVRELGDQLGDNPIKDEMLLNGDDIGNSKVINLQVTGVDAESLILMLEGRGVYISAGSACRSLELEPSRVLKAMGLTDAEAYQSVRISFSCFNTVSDATESAKSFAECILALINMSDTMNCV